MVIAVAVFDREDVLVYFRVSEREKQRHDQIAEFLYCSADIIADKARFSVNKASQEPYLGSLLLNNTFRSYGYLTNGSTKFILVVDVMEQSAGGGGGTGATAGASGGMLKDSDIRVLFKKLHVNYCSAIANPFYVFGTPLWSSQFDRTVSEFFA